MCYNVNYLIRKTNLIASVNIGRRSTTIHTILFSLYKGFQQVNRSEVMWMPGIKARHTFKERSYEVES